MVETAQLPGEEAKVEEKDVVITEDEDSRDMALFRHSTTSGAVASNGDPSPMLSDHAFTAEDFEPVGSSSLIPSSSASSKTIAQLRHLCISQQYGEMAKVDGYLLKMAINAAFSQSTAISAVEELVLCLDANLDKSLRAAALDNGFKIVGSAALDIKSGVNILEKSGKLQRMGYIMETILYTVWPLSFTQEILILRRQDADVNLIRQ